MAAESEVKAEKIQGEMDETRHALADKLATLGDKITGTVEDVEETVENVTETASQTVEAVKETVSSTVETVKETFNLQRQVEERPWLVVGAAVLVGYVGGRLIEGARSRPSRREQFWPPRQDGFGYDIRSAYSGTTESARPQTAAGQTASQPSWFSGITQRFGSEINTLKGLALGTLFGVIRDMVTQNVPQALKGELGEMFDNMAQHAGGKPIQGSLISEDQDQQESGQSESSGYPQEEQGQQATASRQPAGQKKGKKAGR